MKKNPNENVNPFKGSSVETTFAHTFYKFCCEGKPFTYEDVENKLPDYFSNVKNVKDVEKFEQYKKKLRQVKKKVKDLLGEYGYSLKKKSRPAVFQYTGEDKDPLRIYILEGLHIEKLYEFCDYSAGVIPISWLNFFGFKVLYDTDSQKKNKIIISKTIDRKLSKIERVPELYEHILKKHVLKIKYKPFDKAERELTFHPQRLVEFNGRWQLFGHAEEYEPNEPENTFALAIDRIEEITHETKKRFKKIPDEIYDNYFKNKVGVSSFYKLQEQDHPKEAKEVIVRTYTEYMYKLTETKPIHSSQELYKEWKKYKDGTYGEYKLTVEITTEFIARILQYGESLEIIEPAEVRTLFSGIIGNMYKRYNT